MRRALVWLLTALLATGQPVGLLAADYLGQVTFNGAPVPGVTVSATQGVRRASATTDRDGIYRLVDLADGVWTLTVEMLGFAGVQREITIPAEGEAQAIALDVLPLEETLRRGATMTNLAPELLTASDDAALPEASAIGGALDGLLINGSLNNAASSPFAQARGLGNNRPRLPFLRSYAAGAQFGQGAWEALGTFQGQFRLRPLRNLLSLTLGYQGGATTITTRQSARMPTDRERSGDFSQTFDVRGAMVRVRDPLTGQPFAGGLIPVDRISPQAAALLALYPRASGAAPGRFNYQSQLTTASRQNGVRARAAYNITTDNQLAGGVTYQRGATDATSLFGFTDARRVPLLDAEASWLLRPSRFMTITTRYQYRRATTESVPFFANRLHVSGLAGIAGNDQDPRNWGPPSLTFASDLAGLSAGRYSSGREQTHLVGVDVVRFRGAHAVGFGGELRTYRNDVFAQQDPRGTFGFTGATTGVDFADFLLGLPQTSAIAFGNAGRSFRGRAYAAYITDDWRVRPSLTVNAGLRWEYESPISEAQGQLANLDVGAGFAAVRSVSPAVLHADPRGIQPRVGIAWRPSAASSLVIRAGYGIYRNTNVYQSIATLLAAQPPFSIAFNMSSDPANPLTLANGFTAAGAGATNTFAVDPDFRVSSAHTWQASVQRDLVGPISVTASYLGTRGTHLMQQLLPNTFPAGAVNPCPACPVGFRYLTSNGRSLRHGAQLQLRHRLSAGFSSTIDYTLAKAMDNAAAFGGATLDGAALVQNWRDPEADYARSNFDQRHLVTASVEYLTGAGTRGGTLLDRWTGTLLKDWTFTVNLSSGSGLPLTPVYFAPIGGTGVVGSLRADVTGVPNNPPRGAYANPASFAPPAAGQWGSAARNSITGPRTFTMNAGVTRTFRVGDRVSLDWRIDATNVLNRVTDAGVTTLITSPQFGLPNRVNEMRRIRSSVRVRF